MVGGGVFNLAAGSWTDDTSMALCLATSLVSVGGFDPTDQMQRYCRWYEDGYLSSTGTCFDIGGTVRDSLERYRLDGNPFAGRKDPNGAGNGCIMRLDPVPLFYHPNRDMAIHFACESSRTTHGASECEEACRLLAAMLFVALTGADKESVLLNHGVFDVDSANIQSIARAEYRRKSHSDVRGTGYVVHCLEAALWCFWVTDNYRDAVLAAANLGDDADTTAAVCGQVAGAFYDEAEIPPAWLDRLAMREEIRLLGACP